MERLRETAWRIAVVPLYDGPALSAAAFPDGDPREVAR